MLISARRRIAKNRAETVFVEAKPPTVLFGEYGNLGFTAFALTGQTRVNSGS